MSAQPIAPLSDAECLVLDRLFYSTHPYGEICTNFAALSADTDMSRADVRTTCRMLRGKGLAEYHSGLMTEDGEFRGAGYCISAAGRDHMEPILDQREATAANAECAS